MRIQKYLSGKGILSRRETEDFIRRGLIFVNGKKVTEMGFNVDPERDRIEISPAGKKEAAQKKTIAVNKPRGIVSSKQPNEGTTIFDLLPQFKALNAVGRLDKESEGLLLLSDDGALTSAVTGNEHLIEKEYEVTVQEDLKPGMMARLEKGIQLSDGMTLPSQSEIISPRVFKIIIKEGRNHQIRRMADALRLSVVNLKRIRIGNLALGKLKPGKWRELSPQEVSKLKAVKFKN